MTRLSSSGWRALAGPLGSAALLSLYSRGGIACALGFVALVPWLLSRNGQADTPGTALRSAWWMSVAFVLAVFFWFAGAIDSYTGAGSGLGLLALAIAAPLLQPQVFAFALARQLVGEQRGVVWRMLAGASAWVAAEWLLPKLFSDTLGHGLYPAVWLRQCADLGGAAGLTFVLVCCNELLAHAITHANAQRRAGLRAIAKPLATVALLIAAMSGYGAWRVSTLQHATADAKPLRVGMIQSNIVDYERLRREKGAYAVVREVLDTHFAMSGDAVRRDRVDALLWSETVYPTTYAHPKSADGAQLDAEIADYVRAANVPLVFGTYDVDARGEYNAAAVLDPHAGLLGFYRKTHLFPLTEYVPPWLDSPTLRGLLPWAGGWTPGDGARVFPLRTADGHEIPVQPLICLDDVDPTLAIDGARLGAQALLGLSNDSWFTQHPVGARLHLTVAAFRSIETRLPQLRATANGVSAAIDATGEIVASTQMDEQALLIGEARIAPPPATLMVRWGDWVGPTALASLLLAAMVVGYGAVRRRLAHGRAAPAPETAYRAEVSLLTMPWAVLAGLLRLVSRGGLLWMGWRVLQGDPAMLNPIAQVWMFGGLCLLPEAAAWAILRSGAAQLRVDGAQWIFEQLERRIEIASRDIAAADAWRLPLPSHGACLTMTATGRRWTYGLAGADAHALMRAMARAAPTTRAAAYAHACLARTRGLLDHAAFKFLLFPLVPALPAFRLHQIIAYGGAFGEYDTFGLKAYVVALLLWWGSWAVNLAMIAAGLRVLVELISLAVLAIRSDTLFLLRPWLERAAKLLYYIGVPAWLAMRMLG